MTSKEREAFRVFLHRRERAGKPPVSYPEYLTLRDPQASRKAFATKRKEVSEAVDAICGGDRRAYDNWRKYNVRARKAGLTTLSFETWKNGPRPRLVLKQKEPRKLLTVDELLRKARKPVGKRMERARAPEPDKFAKQPKLAYDIGLMGHPEAIVAKILRKLESQR